MSANLLPSVFTIEIGGTPTLTFEAQNLREAREHEEWLKDDLAGVKSDGCACRKLNPGVSVVESA